MNAISMWLLFYRQFILFVFNIFWLNITLSVASQFRCHGVTLVGLASPNKAPRPPLHKRKAPLLTTFWRRFCCL